MIDTGGSRQATEAEGARWVNIVLSNAKRALDDTYQVTPVVRHHHRLLQLARQQRVH